MSKAGLEPAALIHQSDIEPIKQPGAPKNLKTRQLEFDILLTINILFCSYFYSIFFNNYIK